MLIPGTILGEYDDGANALRAAEAERRRGGNVTVTAGIHRLYAVRVTWDHGYLVWRKGFSNWLLDRFGELQ